MLEVKRCLKAFVRQSYNGTVCWLWILILITFASCAHRGENVSEQYEQAQAMFQKVQGQFRQGDFQQAETGFKKCLSFCQQDQFLGDDSIMEMLPVTMVQLMNTYQAAGQTDECIKCFEGLANSKNTALTRYSRDIQVLLAYSLSRTNREEEAVRLMDKVLKMPLHKPTPDKLFRDYAYASAVYYCVPEEQGKVFRCGREALRQAKFMKKKVGVQWLVSLMGSLYQRTGDVYKAILMYEEGIEIAGQTQDTLAMVDLNRGLANFLLSWDMTEEAEQYAQASVALLDSMSVSNPSVSATAYVTRTKVADALHQPRQALFYLRKARKASLGMPYNSGPSDVDVMEGTILVRHPKRCAEGLNLLRKASRGATFGIKATAYLEMAKCYLGKGEAALDSMYAILNQPEHPLVREEAYEYALSHYLKANNAQKVMQYARFASSQKETNQTKEVLKKTVRSLVKLETDKKNEQMKRQVAQMRERTLLYIVSVVLILMLLVGAVLLFVRKRMVYKRKYHLVNKQLDTTQKNLDQMTKDNRKIEKMLRVMEKPDTEKIKLGVSLPEILMEKGEEQFRKLFNRSYPYFLPALQQQSLSPLTTKEVLLCMLLALKKDNAEISNMLHVVRKSLNMSKYRLRKKFDLGENGTLEDFLQGIMKENEDKMN